MKNESHMVVGATYAVLVSAFPTWLLDTVTKIVIAIVTAFLTGMAHKAGHWLVQKISGVKK